MSERIVQTAGHDQLRDFAPEFAHFNDDVLFGENWNNQDFDLKPEALSRSWPSWRRASQTAV